MLELTRKPCEHIERPHSTNQRALNKLYVESMAIRDLIMNPQALSSVLAMPGRYSPEPSGSCTMPFELDQSDHSIRG